MSARQIPSSDALLRRLDGHLDRHDRNPSRLTLESRVAMGQARTGHAAFDQVRGFQAGRVELGGILGEEWKNNLHSRRLVFAVGKLINARRAECRFPAQANADAASRSRPSLAEAGLEALTGSANLAAEIAHLLEGAPRDWPLRNACENILRGAADLRAALGTARVPAPGDHGHDHDGHSHGHGHGHGHDHGGGAIVVDVDEAIHGLYAAISYLVQAIKGGGGEVAREFGAEAHTLAHSPLTWVKDQGAPHGMADFALGVGVGGALLPFSVLAMKAGVEEIRGARHEHKRLGRLKEQLLERLDRLPPSRRGSAADGLRAVRRLEVEQQLADLAFSRRQNRDGGMVGGFSLASGAAIAAKVGLETGAKSAFIATAGASGSAAAAAAAGIAGTFVLGPLAAGSAVGLGATMVHKSAAKAKAFRAEKRDTLAAHRDLREARRSSPLEHYGDFLEQKLDQHQRFYDTYRDWNKGFLAGSGIYTAGTLAKVGMVAAVGVGAVALAEPATLGTVIALGAVGGLMMGASSHQFLSGHGRHHRYEKYFKTDDLELDRHFLAGADLLCLSDPRSGPLAGLELRSDFHQHIYGREELRQDLLERIAADSGKRFTGRYTYTADTRATRDKRGEKPGKRARAMTQIVQRRENAMARLASARAIGGTLASGRPGDAAQAGRDAWNHQRTALSKTHVARWLDSNDAGEPVTMMKAVLDPQLALVQKRLDMKLRAYAAVRAQGDVSLEDGRKLRDLLVDLDRDLARDDALHRQLSELRHGLDQQGDDAAHSERIVRFISLQKGALHDGGRTAAPLEQSHRDLAHYLLDDAPTRYRDLRGMLLETELQATRLRGRFHAAMTAPEAS